MLAISIPWQKEELKDTSKILEEVLSMGVKSIELGYTLEHKHVEEIIAELPKKGMSVSSVHNFSPVPYDAASPRHPSNHYRLTATDEQERKLAVKWTKNSVDVARRVKAPAVVIHAGMIELGDPRSPEVLNLYKEGKGATAEFNEVRSKLLKERESAKGPFWQALLKSLDELMPYAQAQGVHIGLETRYYPTEIPNFKEIGELLGLYRKFGMRYWHDVGHAEVNSRLGITAHEDYLNAYKADLLGVHVHGVFGLRDHNAPFCGDFDLEKVLGHFNKDMLIVIESRFGSFDELKAAVAKLKKYA